MIERSPRVRPRIAAAGAHCVYLRRELLDRVVIDTDMADVEQTVADLSRRAAALGMAHVAADDVYVVCPPSDADEPRTDDEREEQTVLRRSLACARVALYGMSVTIDARALGPGVGGTQHYTVELVTALASSEGLRVRVVVPPDLSPAAAERFEQTPGLEILTYEQAAAGVPPSDVVHRPQQVFTGDDLRLLQLLGERVVIGQQDLIAYRNPTYHATPQAWRRYRRVTRLALTVADRAVVFSEHARADVIAEDLLAGERCDVVGIGADVLGGRASGATTPIEGVPAERDLLVCIGADYAHKNRPFAIALLRALRERHGWQGALMLAGAHVAHGSSRAEEQALLAGEPELAGAVIDLGPIEEAQKAWLYERCRAVLYPTLYEGFGLVPFEAARSGKPCLFAPQASLVELAGAQAATLVPWDADRSSDAVAPLLVEGPARERHLRLLRDAAEGSRWSEVVARLRATYERALASPWRASAPRAWEEVEREGLIVDLHEDAEAFKRAYNSLRTNIGIGLPLVAEGGLLSRDEQRGLMRLAARRGLHGVLLGPVGLLGRLGSSAGAGEEDPV